MIELIFILFLSIVDVFLIIRFVQPELVYTVREQLGPVISNRLIMDAQVHKEPRAKRSRKFRRLFWQDHRGESRIFDGDMVRTRLMRNRARLRSIESTRDTGQEFPESQDVAACLEELADLLHGVSRRLQPTGIYVHDVVDAPRLLRTIHDWQQDPSAAGERDAATPLPASGPAHQWAYNVDREADALQAVDSRHAHAGYAHAPPEDVDLEGYFEKTPMPLEQAIELVYAALYALSYRID